MSNTNNKPMSLETVIAKSGGPVKLLRSSNLGRYVFPGIPPEFTNWRAEQRAWKDGLALLEQSYHMTELQIRGRGALAFLSEFAINKLDQFPAMRAKQLVLAGHDGYLIGDVILFHEEEEFYRAVGAPFAINWLLFNAQNTSHDVVVAKEDNWTATPVPRDVFRLQVQGPHALPLMREVTNGALPDIKFFHMGDLKIAGKDVRALRHGMAGTPGFELYGKWDDQHAVREALELAGAAYDMRKVGAFAYSTGGRESGWMAMPLPAIYHSEKMKPYRQWLNSKSIESFASLGGSLVSDNITDYYVDPIEVGYGGLVDWTRDFLGRDALRKMADNQKRKKVTLVWNDDDVADTMRASLFDEQQPALFMSLPTPTYATFQSDAVMKNGNCVGVSQWAGFSANAQHMLSLALVDIEDAVPGTELIVRWGEPNSHRKPVDRHKLRDIRVSVASAPYFEKVIKTK